MKILIIDKYPIIRKGLILILQERYPESIVYELYDFIPTDQPPSDFKPDLIIVSINHLNYSGDQRLINRVRRFYPAPGMIAYDEQTNYDMLISCFQSGVNGYLSKQSDLDELLDCIAEVLKGKKYANNEVLMELMLKKYPGTNKQPKQKKLTLTSHEQEIANYLSKGMKTSLIAKTLQRKTSTISTIKATIFRKLNVDNVISLKDAL